MWLPDGAGWRARIGLLIANPDLNPDSEFHAMAPPGVSIHATRIPLGVVGPGGAIAPSIGPEAARAFAESPRLDEAAAMLALNPLHVVVYAFTSSSYLLGVKGDHELAARLAERTRGIPVVISSLSAVAGLQALGVRRIALIHPPWYAPELDRLGAQYFRSQGFDVVFHAPAPLRPDFGEIFPSQIHEWARAHVPDRAEAVFIGGTGMRAVGAIRPLEEDLGRPVLTANQVSLWRALQIADAHAAVAGYGRLFTV